MAGKISLLIAVLLLPALPACRKYSVSSSLKSTSIVTDWSDLKEGHRFRISPSNELSKCYLPGSTLSLQNCGDNAYWQIKKNINTQVKVVQSLLDYRCLSAMDGGLITAPCRDDDKNQMIAYGGGGLGKASFDDKAPQPILQDVSLLIADLTPRDEDPLAKMIQIGKIENGSSVLSGKSISNEISWGYIPRINSIAVATEKGKVVGIQLRYAHGTSILMGDCSIDASGNCQVKSEEHSDRPNPYIMDDDEYIKAIGMKFSEETSTSAYTTSVRIIELVVETNKAPKKPALWVGGGDSKAKWHRLEASQNYMIAGLNAARSAGSLIGLGMIMVDLDAYKAHNSDVFGKGSSVAGAVKDGDQVMGLTFGNTRTWGGSAISPKVAVDRDWETLFKSPTFQFSSTFNASSMQGPVNLSQVRIYFDSGMPIGIMITPQKSQNNSQTEIYGVIPAQSQPQIFFEIKSGDYIKEVSWRPGDFKGKNITGPFLTSLKFELASGASHEYTTPSQENIPWKVGLYKEGYAIVGLFGTASDAKYPFAFGARGIFNLGAWFAKVSDLPE